MLKAQERIPSISHPPVEAINTSEIETITNNAKLKITAIKIPNVEAALFKSPAACLTPNVSPRAEAALADKYQRKVCRKTGRNVNNAAKIPKAPTVVFNSRD